jgi:signal transduction histidine kinase
MNEELYDPDCTSCEQAQKDYAKLEQEADDLAALVRRLVHSLRKAAPDNELSEKALDYLMRHGRQGTPLREVPNG